MTNTECYQTLATWISQPFDPTNRVYLELHPELFADDIEQFLSVLIHEAEAYPDEQKELWIRLRLLQDARERGGTVQAVRESYINMFGGLIVDLPDYLIEAKRQLDTIAQPGSSESMVAVCKLYLHRAIEQTVTDERVLSETTAELLYHLGNVFIHASLHCGVSLLERVVSYYNQALEVYTLTRYPIRRTEILIALGTAYTRCPSMQQKLHMEEAMHYYELSVENYSTHHLFPRSPML